MMIDHEIVATAITGSGAAGLVAAALALVVEIRRYLAARLAHDERERRHWRREERWQRAVAAKLALVIDDDTAPITIERQRGA